MMTLLNTRSLLGGSLAIALLAASCGGKASPAPAQSALDQATRGPATPTPVVATAPIATVTTTAPIAASATTAATTTASSTAAPQGGGTTPVPQATAAPRASSVSLTIRAANLAFDKSVLRVPAGATVTATLQNDDAGVQHNLAFGLPGLAHGETCTGPCSTTQTFTATTAGSYFFLCTIHDMSGTFVVE